MHLIETVKKTKNEEPTIIWNSSKNTNEPAMVYNIWGFFWFGD